MSKLYDQLKQAAKAREADPSTRRASLIEAAMERVRAVGEANASRVAAPDAAAPQLPLFAPQAAEDVAARERLDAHARSETAAAREADARAEADASAKRAHAERAEMEQQAAQAQRHREEAQALAARGAAEWAERAAMAESARAEAETWAAAHASDRAASEERRAAAERAKAAASRRALDATRNLMRSAEIAQAHRIDADAALEQRAADNAERKRLRPGSSWKRALLPVVSFAIGAGLVALVKLWMPAQGLDGAGPLPTEHRASDLPLRLDYGLDLDRRDGTIRRGAAAQSSLPDRAPSK